MFNNDKKTLLKFLFFVFNLFNYPQFYGLIPFISKLVPVFSVFCGSFPDTLFSRSNGSHYELIMARARLIIHFYPQTVLGAERYSYMKLVMLITFLPVAK